MSTPSPDPKPKRASADPAALRLAASVRAHPGLMRALLAARAVAAPDWYIAAGAIRDTVWDGLHRRPAATPRDVDLVFFDAHGGEVCEREVEDALRTREPDLPWQAKNQAAVHTWYPEHFGVDVAPFAGTAEAIATFPETAACVGVRLLEDDEILVVAPYGLDDLLACICRHNPARVSAGYYERRVAQKGWRERWPMMRYVPAGGATAA